MHTLRVQPPGPKENRHEDSRQLDRWRWTSAKRDRTQGLPQTGTGDHRLRGANRHVVLFAGTRARQLGTRGRGLMSNPAQPDSTVEESSAPAARTDVEYHGLDDGGVVCDWLADRIHTLNL